MTKLQLVNYKGYWTQHRILDLKFITCTCEPILVVDVCLPNECKEMKDSHAKQNTAVTQEKFLCTTGRNSEVYHASFNHHSLFSVGFVGEEQDDPSLERSFMSTAEAVVNITLENCVNLQSA